MEVDLEHIQLTLEMFVWQTMSQVNIYREYVFNPWNNFLFFPLLYACTLYFSLSDQCGCTCVCVCLWMHKVITSMWEALVWFLAASENYNARKKENNSGVLKAGTGCVAFKITVDLVDMPTCNVLRDTRGDRSAKNKQARW